METMVATVLIVIIFMVASLLMNSLMAAKVKGNTQPVREKLQELEYLYTHGQLQLPYSEDWEDWEIRIEQENGTAQNLVQLKAVKKGTDQQLINLIVSKP